MRASVFISERPIERGNVNTTSSFDHQIEPGVVDGRVGHTGIKLQAFRDALDQNNPDRKEKKCLNCKVQHVASHVNEPGQYI